MNCFCGHIAEKELKEQEDLDFTFIDIPEDNFNFQVHREELRNTLGICQNHEKVNIDLTDIINPPSLCNWLQEDTFTSKQFLWIKKSEKYVTLKEQGFKREETAKLKIMEIPYYSITASEFGCFKDFLLFNLDPPQVTDSDSTVEDHIPKWSFREKHWGCYVDDQIPYFTPPPSGVDLPFL